MYDRVLVITINSYYSKVPSTGIEYRYRGTFKKYPAHLWILLQAFTRILPAKNIPVFTGLPGYFFVRVANSDVNRVVQRSNLFWRILPRANYEKFIFKF